MSTDTDDWDDEDESPEGSSLASDIVMWFVHVAMWGSLAIAVAALMMAMASRAGAGQESLDAWLKAQSKPQEWHGVLVFTAKYCGPCVGQKQALDTLAKDFGRTVHYRRLPGESKNAAFVLIDIQEDPDVMAKYGITLLPTFVVLRGSTVIEKYDGVADTPHLKRLWEASKGMK